MLIYIYMCKWKREYIYIYIYVCVCVCVCVQVLLVLISFQYQNMQKGKLYGLFLYYFRLYTYDLSCREICYFLNFFFSFFLWIIESLSSRPTSSEQLAKILNIIKIVFVTHAPISHSLAVIKVVINSSVVVFFLFLAFFFFPFLFLYLFSIITHHQFMSRRITHRFWFFLY